MGDILTERVLRAVEQIPSGKVVAYGDLARLVGTGPRQVGRIMSTWGSSVAWWRVTNASGDLPLGLIAAARRQWEDEGIERKPNGRGCRIAHYRADLAQLTADYEGAVTDLPDA